MTPLEQQIYDIVTADQARLHLSDFYDRVKGSRREIGAAFLSLSGRGRLRFVGSGWATDAHPFEPFSSAFNWTRIVSLDSPTSLPDPKSYFALTDGNDAYGPFTLEEADTFARGAMAGDWPETAVDVYEARKVRIYTLKTDVHVEEID